MGQTTLAARVALLTASLSSSPSTRKSGSLAARLKGLPLHSPLLGEEWTSGPWAVLSYVDALRKTLERARPRRRRARTAFKRRSGTWRPPRRSRCSRTRPSTGSCSTASGPSSGCKPGVTLEDDLRRSAGLGQRMPHDTAGVALVLGAGNITSIAPARRALHAVRRQPRRRAQAEPDHRPDEDVFDKIFAPFIELGVVEILTGDVDDRQTPWRTTRASPRCT